MTEAEILSKLTDIFHDVFEMPSIVLSPEMTAQDVPGWDSVSHITMVVETEQSFGVKFHTTEIEALKNVGDLVRLIQDEDQQIVTEMPLFPTIDVARGTVSLPPWPVRPSSWSTPRSPCPPGYLVR